MMRRLAVRSFHVATAAALLQAGVALACPQPPGGSGTPSCGPQSPTTLPPDCASDGALDLDVGVKQRTQDSNGRWVVNVKTTRDYFGTGTVCDAMVLFQVSDDAASSDLTVSLHDSPSTALRNVRVVKVEGVSTPLPSGYPTDELARYGSGAFCVWASETLQQYSVDVYKVTVEAFDPAGNVHKGQALIAMTCTGSATGATTQPLYYQKNVAGTAIDSSFCTHMTSECVAPATPPPTCGGESRDVCQCTDITTPPAPPPEPATPGNVCIELGERVYCGPVAPTVPGTPTGEICINHGDTVLCGPVSVCVTSGDTVVCGPATGPGTNPGDVCISREGTVCGPVGGSGYGPGNDGGDVCVSREGTVCGSVTTDTGCVSTTRDGNTCTGPAPAPGDVCVHGAETATACGQVPVAAASGGTGSTGGTAGTSSTSSSASAASGASPKTGCAAFPGADVGAAGLLALLCLRALRRRP